MLSFGEVHLILAYIKIYYLESMFKNNLNLKLQMKFIHKTKQAKELLLRKLMYLRYNNPLPDKD